jgi:hypothetical protein
VLSVIPGALQEFHVMRINQNLAVDYYPAVRTRDMDAEGT